MVIIDGSFLIGVAAILTSLATLWRSVRGADRAEHPEYRPVSIPKSRK